MNMKTAVITVIVYSLLLCLYGCTKTPAAESPSTIPPESDQTVSASPALTTDTEKTAVTIPEGTVIVNELDDNENELIHLGMTRDEVYSVLEENGVYYNASTSDTGDSIVDFHLYQASFLVMFDEENIRVNGIEVSGPEPVPATATQKGLNIGDSLEQMVALYGDEYITDTIEFTNGNTYSIYIYKLGDHSFNVDFSYDGVRSWRIWESPPDWHYYLKKDGLYRTDLNTGDIIKINGQTSAGGIIITEDWVYYRADSRIWRMDNENKREQLTEEDWWNPSLSGGWLYCINSSGIARMKPDGSEKEQILECACNEMVVTEQYVFYALDVPEIDELQSGPGAEDGPWFIGELHRTDLNGEGDIKLIDMIIDLSAYESTIYFTDSEDGNFYSMNPETLEKKIVDEIRLVQQSYFDSSFCFLMTHIDRQIYRLSLADGTLTQLTQGFWGRCLGVLNGYVYIDDSSGEPNSFYRIKVDGIELEKVE